MATLPLVLSYPRSGMNWLRHSVETMTGLHTPGRDLNVIDDTPYAFCRLHNIRRGRSKATPRGSDWDRVCLILRDYRENYVRTPVAQRSWFTTLKKWNFTSYAENIRYFHQFDGPKLLLRYESHVAGFGESIRFLQWAGIPFTPLTQADFAAESARSKLRYGDQHAAYYRRTANREIDDAVKDASRGALVRVLGEELFAKYLGCYDTDEQQHRLRIAA